MAIFSNMIGTNVEVFMDDFSVFGTSYDECLYSLGLVLKRCVETNLQFIKDFSKIYKPLCNLLEKDVPFKFDEECLATFESLKKSLTTAPVITALDWNEPFKMMCDASDYAVGAVLGQRKQNIFHVEFELEIKDRKGIENHVADHLSCWEDQGKASLDKTLINDFFLDEQLFGVQEEEPWFADLVNYLVSNVIPPELSYAQRKKFLHEVKWYRWDEPFLFR
ncbi:uncharacterized protein LOC141696173 [Apium graveolens]|uniref:uncharacterized protein LOC141696173 n=1 Tax=Apium graveolens TaxID=4045 RepID=UPI003D790F63